MDPLEVRLTVLRELLDRSDSAIRNYDELVIKIKGFAITACAAATLFAVDKQRSVMYLVAILAAIGFGIMDIHTRSIQRIFIVRSNLLEKFFRDKSLDEAMRLQSLDLFNLPTLNEISQSRKSLKNVRQEFFHFQTYYLYMSLVLLISLVAAIEILL